MADVLVLYASTHGHTAKIARRVADAVRGAGLEPDVQEAKSASGLAPGDYRGVIVGASIHAGHHQREVVDWVKSHATALSGMPGTAVTFAGALQYREYDFFTRRLIRLMMKRGGHPTDTSQDYDYTDWDAVDRFGREFAASLT
jgi:menaquinone-dependent protoporphyrinogen oxidase